MRPPLPPLETRAERFDLSVGTAAEFLRSAWPELRDVHFEVGAMPPASDDAGIPRWTVLPDERRIIPTGCRSSVSAICTATTICTGA